MKSSALILTTAILFIICTAVLSFIVRKDLDPNYEKDWFSIGFMTLQGDTPDFIIENHSSEESFHYDINSKGKTLSEGSFSVKKGESLDIHPENIRLKAPYTITVSPENDPKKSESLTRK